MKIELFVQLFIPLIASNLSLLFALMSRNAMVSERIRKSCVELAERQCGVVRGLSLTHQIDEFEKRYDSNKKAIVRVLISVGLFVLAAALSTFVPLISIWIPSGVLLLAVVFTGWALALTFLDFSVATVTLKEEIRYSKECHTKRHAITDGHADASPSSVPEAPETALRRTEVGGKPSSDPRA